MHRLIAGIRAFQQGALPFSTQGLTEGQSPEALLIVCSDSRVVPHLVTQTGPGHIFVIRNAGNMLADPGAGSAEEASIEYGVQVLRIPHLIVCGHTHCGAMRAILDGADGLPAVNRWLAAGADTRVRAAERGGDRDPLDAIVEANVLVQLERARSYPAVRAAEESGALKLHGWVYDIATARFSAWDPLAQEFSPVVEEDRRVA